LRTVAIVPAAGSGKRLGHRGDKPFVFLAGKPLISYALSRLDSSDDIDEIVIAVRKKNIRRLENLIKRFKFKKISDVVEGGATRFESVRNCLDRINKKFDIVLVHDAARPFLENSIIKDSIRFAFQFGACVVAVPETDTLKSVDKNLFVRRTIDRNEIFHAETPQVFRFGLIKKAYAIKIDKGGITDDASLVEILGKRVKILRGAYRNIKVTTKDDLEMAEYYLKTSK